MEQCPVCGGSFQGTELICSACGFDGSADREQYPTLVRAKSVMPSKRGQLLGSQRELQQQVQAMKQEMESLRAEVVALAKRVQQSETQKCLVLSGTYANSQKEEAVASTVLVETGMCGINVNWTFFLNDGLLQIEGNGAMKDYPIKMESPWEKYKNQITKVQIKSGVTTIGLNTFEGCENLRSVQMADTVQTIQGSAFKDCKRLSEVQMSAAIREIGMEAFSGCESLTGIELSNELKVLNIGVFAECKNLRKVILPEGLKKIRPYAFLHCTALEVIRIPRSVEDIPSEAFEDCPVRRYR